MLMPLRDEVLAWISEQVFLSAEKWGGDKSTPGVDVSTDITDIRFLVDRGVMVVSISIKNHGRRRRHKKPRW